MKKNDKTIFPYSKNIIETKVLNNFIRDETRVYNYSLILEGALIQQIKTNNDNKMDYKNKFISYINRSFENLL